jgi:hypothetical protein
MASESRSVNRSLSLPEQNISLLRKPRANSGIFAIMPASIT